MVESELIGYVRKSKTGNALKLNIAKDAFENANTYSSQDGSEYVQLVARIDKVVEIIEGEREVTSLCQIVDSA